MSWQDHINKLMSSNALDGAAIIGLQDAKVYGISKDLSIGVYEALIKDENGEAKKCTANEAQILVDFCNKKGKVPVPPGIWINKKRYYLLNWRDESNVGYVKTNQGGACIAKTNKCVIVGVWSNAKIPSRNGGDCNKTVEKVAELFMKVNY